MSTDFIMYEVSSGSTVSNNVFHNFIMLYLAWITGLQPSPCVVLAYDEDLHAAEMSKGSNISTCLLLNHRRSLQKNDM